MRISVHDQIGPYAIAVQDGEGVYEQLRAALAKGKHVVLDFAGVKVVTASFLNPAVGELLSEFDVNQVRRSVQPCNLPEYAEELWELVLIDSAEYFALDQEGRDQIDEIVANAILDR